MKQELATGQKKIRGRAYLFFISFIAAVGGFNWGYDVILMSGAILLLKSYFHISHLRPELFSQSFNPAWIEGFTMTSAIYGILVGTVLGGRFADRIGRKRALILSSVLLMIGAIGSTAANTLLVWNLFRILGGVGGGLASLISPMYISEIAPAKIRGLLVSFNQFAIVLGAFLANVVTYLIAKDFGSNPECWRWMFASACVPILIFGVGLFYVPDSPRWLIMQGRAEQAHAILPALGWEQNPHQVIAEVNRSLRHQEAANVRDLFGPRVRTATVIAAGLAVFQQIIGVSTLIYYAPSIFVQAGISSNASAIGNTVILRVGDILWTLFAILAIDKLGRRPLLLAGMTGIALGQVLMGVCFYEHARPLLLLFAFLICEGAFNLSAGACVWVIISEIFPLRLRAKGMALATFLMLGSSLLMAQIFPVMIEFFQVNFGSESGVFWLYAFISIGAFIFCFLMVPETKGRSLEEISSLLTKSPLTSK